MSKVVAPDNLVKDKFPGIVLKNHSDIAGAAYVDNYGIFGLSKELVNQHRCQISTKLKDIGLSVHEEEDASTSGEFVGLELRNNRISIKVKRIWRIRLALQQILARGFISGAGLEIIIGHITWILMVRREALSILNECYTFIRHHRSSIISLPPGVRRELWQISSLLPLFHSDLGAGWSGDIIASDASPAGLGVTYSSIPPETVGAIGRVRERWRYRVEKFVCARRSALSQQANSPNINGNDLECDDGARTVVDDLAGEFVFDDDHIGPTRNFTAAEIEHVEIQV